MVVYFSRNIKNVLKRLADLLTIEPIRFFYLFCIKQMKKLLVKTLLFLGAGIMGTFTTTAVLANGAGGFGAVDWVADIKGISGTGQGTGATNILTVVKTFINWVLGLLSLIALCVCLYGGFQMVTAAGDDTKYKAGFKVLKQAAIGLIVVGLSWIIVSSIFWVLGQVGASAGS